MAEPSGQTCDRCPSQQQTFFWDTLYIYHYKINLYRLLGVTGDHVVTFVVIDYVRILEKLYKIVVKKELHQSYKVVFNHFRRRFDFLFAQGLLNFTPKGGYNEHSKSLFGQEWDFKMIENFPTFSLNIFPHPLLKLFFTNILVIYLLSFDKMT